MNKMKKIIIFYFTAVMIMIGILGGSHDLSAAKSKKEMTLIQGETKKLPLKNRKNYIYKSNNKKVISVTKKGIVKAKNVGKAKITARKGKRKIICMVKVVNNEVSQLTPPPTTPTSPNGTETSAPGGVIGVARGSIANIEAKENGIYRYTVNYTKNSSYIFSEWDEKEITTIIFDSSYSKAEVGQYGAIILNTNVQVDKRYTFTDEKTVVINSQCSPFWIGL